MAKDVGYFDKNGELRGFLENFSPSKSTVSVVTLPVGNLGSPGKHILPKTLAPSNVNVPQQMLLGAPQRNASMAGAVLMGNQHGQQAQHTQMRPLDSPPSWSGYNPRPNALTTPGRRASHPPPPPPSLPTPSKDKDPQRSLNKLLGRVP